ncbi:MAG: 4-(cytidine 5'-diphospho)-2-C-methyl-D-erythritol kinase [Ruminococcus sp.]|nr:4-(cytidine 5'-diphospho)-2-C-methyl-D-erythritol kinase [Ruminococcus sp.]
MAKYSSAKVAAFGKLNLMLDIVGINSGGYHELETVMQSVSLFDTLDMQINNTGENKIICEKAGFPCDSSNLIWKAVAAFEHYTGLKTGGITASVDKQLPSMAGMAGGSADCAATLCALDAIFDTKLKKVQLCEIGVGLGADVPFCIVGGTQLCRGVGEIMTELALPRCAFVVVKPDVSISTPAAFKKYDSLKSVPKCDTKAFVKGLMKSYESKGLQKMCKHLFNALEYAAQEEEIETAKKRLVDAGALGALMTGSGSAVFGVFENPGKAQAALEKIKNDYPQAWICNPVSAGTQIISLG